MERGTMNEEGTAIEGPLTARQEWSDLDRRGNWLEFKVGVTPVVQTRQVNGVNQYTSVGYPPAPDYDAAGNMTVDPLGWNHSAGPDGLKYEYDEENRLTKVKIAVNDGLVMEFKYDALGRRVETIQHWNPEGDGPLVTRHVYSGLETIQEYVCCQGTNCGVGVPACGTSWQLAREFVWGDSARFPEPVAMVDYTSAGLLPTPGVPEIVHYLRDVLGSVTGLTDAAGNLVERYMYDPYGKPLIERWNPVLSQWEESIGPAGGPASAFGNPFLWTGQRYDANVELYHFLFRTYSPYWGRWLQWDPIEYDAGSVNLYEYVFGNPLYWIDPYGLFGDLPWWVEFTDKIFGKDWKREQQIVNTTCFVCDRINDAADIASLGGTAVVKAGIKKVGSKLAKDAVEGAAERVAKELAEKAAREAAEKAAKEAAEKAAKEAAERVEKRKCSKTLRSEWEKAEQKPWPIDPETGKKQEVSHKTALADGGTNDLNNVEPLPHDDHVRRHSEQGDFARWAKRAHNKQAPPPKK
jgi:RHS repeat-associated protein